MYIPIGLSYNLDALEPYYSKETLSLHYNVLYKGYVDKLNIVEGKLNTARQTGNYDNIKCLSKELSFQGSGEILHRLFFENLAPPNESTPDDELLERINKDFGNYDTFKKQFTEASKAVEGSAWCILVFVPELNKLEILQCEKHQNLTLWGCIPLLILDMWEHSYYLQYKTSKPDYINAFWNIVNWDIVNSRFKRV